MGLPESAASTLSPLGVCNFRWRRMRAISLRSSFIWWGSASDHQHNRRQCRR